MRLSMLALKKALLSALIMIGSLTTSMRPKTITISFDITAKRIAALIACTAPFYAYHIYTTSPEEKSPFTKAACIGTLAAGAVAGLYASDAHNFAIIYSSGNFLTNTSPQS